MSLADEQMMRAETNRLAAVALLVERRAAAGLAAAAAARGAEAVGMEAVGIGARRSSARRAACSAASSRWSSQVLSARRFRGTGSWRWIAHAPGSQPMSRQVPPLAAPVSTGSERRCSMTTARARATARTRRTGGNRIAPVADGGEGAARLLDATSREATGGAMHGKVNRSTGMGS
jgi:hypothetical protein